MVKLAVSVIFAAALASAVYAQDLSSTTLEDVMARELTSNVEHSALFRRAAAKVMGDLFSREELGEMFGREVDELTQRDIEELFEREIEVDELASLSSRELSDSIESSLFARQEEGAADAAPAPAPAGEEKPKKDAAAATEEKPKKAPKEKGVGKKDGEEKPKKKSTFWGRLTRWFRKVFTPGKKDDKAKDAGKKGKSKDAGKKDKSAKKTIKKDEPEAAPAPAPAPAAADAAGAEAAPAPEGREFLKEPIERSLDMAEEVEDLLARFWENPEFDNEARDFEDFDEVFERSLDLSEPEMYEREPEPDFYEPEMYERDFSGEWDDALFERAYDILSQMEELD